MVVEGYVLVVAVVDIDMDHDDENRIYDTQLGDRCQSNFSYLCRPIRARRVFYGFV